MLLTILNLADQTPRSTGVVLASSFHGLIGSEVQLALKFYW